MVDAKFNSSLPEELAAVVGEPAPPKRSPKPPDVGDVASVGDIANGFVDFSFRSYKFKSHDNIMPNMPTRFIYCLTYTLQPVQQGSIAPTLTK